jgi:electron transfer flavoprotein beta subunit
MAIRKINAYDLIICGKQAIDGDTAQVGPGIAAHLDIPQITYVRKIEELDAKTIVAQRTTEDGYAVLKSSLPCLLTVVKEINEPRIASLKGKMKAKKIEITTWNAADLGAQSDRLGTAGSPTEVWKIYTPPAKNRGQMFDGSSEEAVNAIVAAVKDHLN